jgi:hypothetical protein
MFAKKCITYDIYLYESFFAEKWRKLAKIGENRRKLAQEISKMTREDYVH